MKKLASFRKRGSTWEYRIRFTDPQTGKRKEKVKAGFKTKKEAQIVAAQIEQEIFLGNNPILKKNEFSVKDWLEEWLKIYGGMCHESTLIARKNYINKSIIPEIGFYQLNQLKRVEYQKFINQLSERYAKKTVQTIHSIFCTAINKAVELEYIQFNKFQNIQIQKDHSIEKRNYLTRDEVSRFLITAKNCPNHHYLIASLLLRTGIRKGELLGLLWEDVNLKEKTISITKSRSNYGVKEPKTPSSYRTISIDNTLVEEIKEYQTWQEKNKEKHGINYVQTNYVITTWNGTPMGTFGVNKVISTIVDKANLPKISPHGLRHTHAIMMLESGNDIKIVSDRLGHSSLNITTDVYLHITKKHEKESILRLESYLKD
ncbi:site-specific integrase [Niallia circulans]|uniref:site-specific integrase n=1 Tax=Niallia circulans TaxID=1397 RepID=UPI001F3F20D8|nr:site-specific integrase [Niallia circulans]